MDNYTDMIELLRDHHTIEDAAISAGDLGTLYNLTKRGVRVVVNMMRQNGVPICSSNCGYWYSTEPEDISKTVRRLQAQINNTQKAVDGLREGRAL